MKACKYIFFCLTLLLLLLVSVIIILITKSKTNYKHIDNTIPKLISPEITTQNNIFMVWVGKEPKINYLIQIKNAIDSFKYHNPHHNLYLFSNIISQNDVNCKVLPINLDQFLYKNTPIENFDFEPLGESFGKSNQIRPAIWSDMFRTVILWKYGGTYIDVDDICIRPLPTNKKNILPSCAIEDKYEEKQYNGGISSNHFGYKWRFGIDPMINIEKGNLFLLEMIKNFPTEKIVNWGQILPTKIFKSDIEKWSKYITPIEWSDILYHPKHDGHTNFDKRYDGPKIKWNHKARDSKIETLLKNYNFPLVKNHHFSSESSDTILASLINRKY